MTMTPITLEPKIERDGEQGLLDLHRACDLLAELVVRRVADEQRLAGLRDAPGDTSPDGRRQELDGRPRLGGRQVAAEGDRQRGRRRRAGRRGSCGSR